MAHVVSSHFTTNKDLPWSASKSGYSPIVLIEIPTASKYLSNRIITVGSTTYENLLARLKDGAIGDISRRFDRKGEVLISSVGVRILNAGLYSDLLDSTDLNNAQVLIKLGFDGAGASDYLTVYDGVVDSIINDYNSMEIVVQDQELKLAEPLALLIGQKYFRGTVEGKGLPIPIILGRCFDLNTYKVEDSAEGTVAIDVGTGDTTIYINEIGAPFPESGDILIGSETISYTSRDLTVASGITVMAFGGLTRAVPATHSVDDTVTTTNENFTYLVGYECQAISNVRKAGSIQTSGFTTTLAASGEADKNITKVEFTTDPDADRITVDADGLNLSTTNLLTNGDFEAGDLSSWTNVAATVAAQQTDIDPTSGAWGMEMTGVINGGTPAEEYQDVTTVIGQRYEVDFWHKHEMSFPTEADYPVINPSFTTDISGWTVVAGTPVWNSGGSLDTGIAGGDGEVYQDVTVGAVPGTLGISTSWSRDTFGGTRLWVGTSTNKTAYGQVFDLGLAGSGTLNIGIVGFTGGTIRVTLRGDNTLYDNVRVFAFDGNADITIKAGTSGDTDAYGSRKVPMSAAGDFDGMSFTALATTTRITFESDILHDQSLKVFVDSVTVKQVSTNPAASIRYLLDNFSTLTLNETVFDTAENLLGGWAFSGLINKSDTAIRISQDMGRQCKSRVYVNASTGLSVMYPYDTNALSVYSFDDSKIVRNSMRVTLSSMDEVYTEFVVWFAPKTGGDNAGGYQGVAFANATEDTHDTIDLATLCSAAKTKFGFDRKFEIFAYMIQDLGTANKLLEYLVKYYTVQKYIANFRSFLNAAHLHEFDCVSITHNLLPSSVDGARFYVEGFVLSPRAMETRFECWQLVDAG